MPTQAQAPEHRASVDALTSPFFPGYLRAIRGFSQLEVAGGELAAPKARNLSIDGAPSSLQAAQCGVPAALPSTVHVIVEVVQGLHFLETLHSADSTALGWRWPA
jgi:hypothetical protein